MGTEQKSVAFAFCVNHKFSVALPALVESILQNCGRRCEFYVLHSTMDEGIKDRLRCTVETFPAPGASPVLTFIHFDAEDSLRDGSGQLMASRFRGGFDAYGRLFLPQILTSVERCIYLDADMVVNGSLEEMCQILDTVPVLACGYLHGKDNWYNSGMLAMNLAALRERGFTSRCLSFIEDHAPSPPDEAVLNGVLGPGEALVVDQRFNCMSNQRQDYSQAVVVHFTGTYKPWMIQTRWRRKKFIWWRWEWLNRRRLKDPSVDPASVGRLFKWLPALRPLFNLVLMFRVRILGQRTPTDNTVEGVQDT